MSDDLWHELKSFFRQWTGMVLPMTIRGPASELVSRLALAQGLTARVYLRYLDDTPTARQVVLDQLGLGTTWFMRDAAGLHALVDALQRAVPREQPVWLWSAGCSSGEEPYSLAMTMADKGMSARILATDLNRLALQRAFAGRYSRRSLRRVPEPWQRRYFDDEGRGIYRIKDHIRQYVTFELHNFQSSQGPPPGWFRFDAVVCRNALIYFDRAQAVGVIERLTNACRPGGYLLLGAIERPLFWMSNVAAKSEAAELVQVSSDPPRATPVPGSVPVPRTASEHARTAPRARTDDPQPRRRKPRPTEPDPRVRIDHLLDRANIAEEEGRPEDSLALIDGAIRQAPLAAPAHLARGLLLKRLGRTQGAIDSLRAARFLDGNGWLAPYQLALCLENIGDSDEALEGYRHALAVIELHGPSGLHKPSIAVDNLTLTVAEVCINRIGRSE